MISSNSFQAADSKRWLSENVCENRMYARSLAPAHFETDTPWRKFCNRFTNFGFEGESRRRVEVGENKRPRERKKERYQSCLSFLPCRPLIVPPPVHHRSPSLPGKRACKCCKTCRTRDHVAFQMLRQCLVRKLSYARRPKCGDIY